MDTHPHKKHDTTDIHNSGDAPYPRLSPSKELSNTPVWSPNRGPPKAPEALPSPRRRATALAVPTALCSRPDCLACRSVRRSRAFTRRWESATARPPAPPAPLTPPLPLMLPPEATSSLSSAPSRPLPPPSAACAMPAEGGGPPPEKSGGRDGATGSTTTLPGRRPSRSAPALLTCACACSWS